MAPEHMSADGLKRFRIIKYHGMEGMKDFPSRVGMTVNAKHLYSRGHSGAVPDYVGS